MPRTYSEELNFCVESLPCAGDEASMPCPVARCAPLADEKIGIGSDSLPLITLRARPHGADPLCLTPCRPLPPPVRAPQVVSVCMSGSYVINKTAFRKRRRTRPPQSS